MKNMQKPRSIVPKDVKEPEYPKTERMMPVTIGPNVCPISIIVASRHIVAPWAPLLVISLTKAGVDEVIKLNPSP